MKVLDSLFGESFDIVMLTVVFGIFFLLFVGVQDVNAKVDAGAGLAEGLCCWRIISGVVLFFISLVLFSIHVYREFIRKG